jgi:hypothetical protein
LSLQVNAVSPTGWTPPVEPGKKKEVLKTGSSGSKAGIQHLELGGIVTFVRPVRASQKE